MENFYGYFTVSARFDPEKQQFRRRTRFTPAAVNRAKSRLQNPACVLYYVNTVIYNTKNTQKRRLLYGAYTWHRIEL